MTHSLDSRKLELAKLRLERLKQWGTIVAIIASLGTAIAAHLKEEEDEGAKEVYRELSGAVEKVSEDQLKLHQDISSIRGYLAGKAENPSPSIVRFFETPASTSRRPHRQPPKPKSAVIEDSPEFDVPQVKPPPDAYKAPPVEQVTRK
jgi:hypothetical protein